jgi:hypothetical protein
MSTRWRICCETVYDLHSIRTVEMRGFTYGDV